jgi:hypothetical protein
LTALLVVPAALTAQDVKLDGDKYSLHGFLRQRASWNMEDPPEIEGDNKYDVSMLRSTVYLELNLFPADWVSLTFVGRADGEMMTSYLDDLDEASPADLQSFYNDADLREWYADFQLGDRTSLRLGKQQVVWGRTDFFRGLDIIHGFDFTWRSFLEVENEILRKPLILANAQIQVPEANGTLQLILRPGIDSEEDIGNTYDLRGGRWANQPNKGVDFFDLGVTFNYDHSSADPDDVNYGIRWSGIAGGVDYSIAYLRTLNNDPVVNSVFDPYKGEIRNAFAEFIHPEVDLFGATLAFYIDPLDIVLRTEMAYTMDQPFNVGTEFFGGVLPGFGGIIEKDTLRLMLAFDRQVSFAQKFLKASRPGFFNLQFFDTWLVDFDRADDLVALAGYGAPINEHNVIGTFILGWNYNNDRLNPTIAAGWDLSNSGSFVIPSVEMVWGDHWRLRLEYDLFLEDSSKLPGEIEKDTALLGYFANNDQFYVRLTYQF